MELDNLEEYYSPADMEEILMKILKNGDSWP
jgi:hypothetical protein